MRKVTLPDGSIVELVEPADLTSWADATFRRTFLWGFFGTATVVFTGMTAWARLNADVSNNSTRLDNIDIYGTRQGTKIEKKVDSLTVALQFLPDQVAQSVVLHLTQRGRP